MCVCVYGLLGNAGIGALVLSVPFVPRFYAVLQNYAKNADPSLEWGHVIFMPIFGSFDVTLVTWAVCLILIGREKFCCAVIGWDPVETPLLLALQCWNNVATTRNNVATKVQCSVLLKIVVANRPV